MRAIATGDQTCVVLSLTGSGDECRFPTITSTNECSDKVTVGGFGVVTEGDMVNPHSKASDCSTDTSVLTTFSSKVTIGGKGVGRIGDKYTSDNIIISGSSKVFIGAWQPQIYML